MRRSIQALILLLLAGLSLPAWSGSPNMEQCRTHYWDWQYRCLITASNYEGTASYRFTSKVDSPVTFKISNWLSICGRPGDLVLERQATLAPKAGATHCAEVRTPNYNVDNCLEVYAFECRMNDKEVPCPDVMTMKREYVGARSDMNCDDDISYSFKDYR